MGWVIHIQPRTAQQFHGLKLLPWMVWTEGAGHSSDAGNQIQPKILQRHIWIKRLFCVDVSFADVHLRDLVGAGDLDVRLIDAVIADSTETVDLPTFGDMDMNDLISLEINDFWKNTKRWIQQIGVIHDTDEILHHILYGVFWQSNDLAMVVDAQQDVAAIAVKPTIPHNKTIDNFLLILNLHKHLFYTHHIHPQV